MIQYIGKPSGKIEVIVGTVRSGKTGRMIRRVGGFRAAGAIVRCFKSSLDDSRGGVNTLSSQDGLKLDAISSSTLKEINELCLEYTPDVIAIDEVNFFTDPEDFDHMVFEKRGVHMLFAGLDLTFQGDPFGAMPHFMALADYTERLYAVCVKCLDRATRTRKLGDGGSVVDPGGAEKYEPLCKDCWVKYS